MVGIKDIKRLFLVIIYKIFLEFSYLKLINPIWGYMGFNLDINYIKLIETYILLIIIYIIVPKSDFKISNVFLQFLYLMMIIPTLSIYAMKNESRVFLYAFVIGFLITILTVKYMPKIKLIRIKVSKKLFVLMLFLITITTYFLIIKDNGMPTLGALNLFNVYKIRSEFVSSLSIINYLLMWQAKIINPFLIGYFYYKGKYKSIILVILFQIVLFLLTAYKSFLFSLVLVLGSVYLIKIKKFYTIFAGGMVLIVLSSFVLGIFKISDYPTSFITNRVLFVPAQNYFFYYDFFSDNQKAYLTQSIIGNIFGLKEIYNTNITYMIGELYYGSSKMMVNTGYLADAYMNFGILGMLFFSILLGIIFILIDQISKRVDKTIVVATFIFPIYSLVDGALQTSLLTHGLLISIILIYFIDNKMFDTTTDIKKSTFDNI
ncbi:oligosaccharide repeat unit polymerase [Ruminiclostridium sufflavum DSM 19573]|uniref:Oligosaccharide repeat unit polymerase n=1 Tax=Ruminiclostridium sufflavum DSM 19573 TaxID=1121337 RepID=A0A318XJ08_9FIRM|nr:O-antigen polymerase [Ruminiclostridium sufflavum]PYG87165.1 oligosaccharide repeat unit polymerase [Ruminiclostridium sufflavum DSM 19573]